MTEDTVLGNYSAAELEEAAESKKAYEVVKRIFDIAASAFALVCLSWFFGIVALAIFIDDPHGSPIFSQTRVGKNGKMFKFYKFRSMVCDAEKRLAELQSRNEKDGPVFKIHDDPRVTRIGRFIRKTSIDELPQLINILRGDMSVVGPRPPLPNEYEKYDEFTKQRLLVTPGLTCYWQTLPHRDEVGFDEWVRLDLKYIKERSLGVDLMLILKTVAVSLTGQGT